MLNLAQSKSFGALVFQARKMRRVRAMMVRVQHRVSMSV
eukprot:COSAG06_NODE_77078_length_117_cov_352.444444_1_plen_38_part_11